MANNFHTIDGWHIVGIEGHNGLHIIPLPPFLVPMWFWKLTFLHPFTMGDKAKPTVMFNGVPAVTHQHESTILWPHLGIIPDPLDLLTPLHLIFGSHKCWLPRGAVEICGEPSTCCVIAGPVSLNADCWEYGKWPTSLVLNPGTVQTTPTLADFLAGALTLAVDLLIDLLFEALMWAGGTLLKKFADKALKPLFNKSKELFERGMKAAAAQMGEVGEKLARGLKSAGDKIASKLKKASCFFTGHPVDATSGSVVDSATDLSLPGAIPLTWERTYSSARALERTSLGRGGWTHNLEQWVERTEEGISFRDGEGRDVYFEAIQPGESRFHRSDRLTLRALEGGRFEVFSHITRLVRHFEPAVPGGRALLRSIQDAFGNTIFLEYAGERLRTVIDTAGREIRVTSTHGGRIVRLEVWAGDSLEQWVDYSYAKMGELASATDALGHSERYAYDEDHRMVKTTLKNGLSFYYEYDEETGWCKKTWGDGGLHTVEIKVDLEKRITWLSGNDEPRILHWNEDGLVVREETPDGILLRTLDYDRDQYLIATTNGAGEMTRYEHDARGNKIKEIDPAGNITEWDHQDDLPVMQVAPDGLVTRYERDARGSIIAVTYPSTARYAFSYDERGHVEALSRDGAELASFTVDAQHNLIEEISGRKAKTMFGYDAMGRPILRTDALGHRTEVDYDRLGRIVAIHRPDGTTSQFVYDALGDPIEGTDALGQVVKMERKGTGVLSKLTYPDGRAWHLEYTAREKLKRIENPRGERYELVYDTAGRIVQETTFDGRVLKYRYSPAGHVSRIEYPDGSFRAFEHDSLGNIVGEASTDGPITFQRDRMGRLLGAVVEQDGRRIMTLFERDSFGRVLAEVQDGRRLCFEHDSQGRRTARTLPDGATTRYRYDALGGLAGLSHDDYEMTVDRDVLGRELARRDASGHVVIRSEYDSMSRIIEQRVEAQAPGAGVSGLVVERLWQYDAVGRVKRMEDLRWGATTYRYDALDRLLEARRGAMAEVFAYDAAGSISQALAALDTTPEQAGERAGFEIGQGDLLRRTDRARYLYDKRGRRIRKEEGRGEAAKRTEYFWDCRDRLRRVKLPSGHEIAFGYDAFGRRVHKEIRDEDGEPRRAVDFVWDGDVLAADIDTLHGKRCFVYDLETGVPLLQAERGEVYSYLTDQVGVPKELVDRAGRVVWSAAHSAWGRVTDIYVDPERAERKGRPVESPFRLLGQYADEETGLCYTRYRYFDAEIGRWCSPDPLGISGGLNLFAFPSPTIFVDPLGLVDPFDIGSMKDLLSTPGHTLRGQDLQRHELLQAAWLKHHGVSSGRSTAIGVQNPAIALPQNPIHKNVSALQRELGLHERANLLKMSAQQNIDVNSAILYDCMVQHGVDPADADRMVQQLKREAEAFADLHVPACKR